MKVRIAILLGIVVGLGSGIGGAQALGSNGAEDTGDWGCAVIRPLNQGICFENPLPPRLPVPSVPS